MFEALGAKLDNLLYDLKLWNTQRIWYKPIAYFTIKRWIKEREFKENEHFETFMEMARINKQLWGWQFSRLTKLYRNTKANQ